MKKLLFLSALALFLIPSLSFTASAQGKVIWTQVVQLNAYEANTNAEAMGIAIFRLTSDMKLHYKLIVQKLDDGDMQTSAHIHYTATSGVALPLASGSADFGINKEIQLTSAQYNVLLNDALYVNFHSVMYPAGNIRGTLR